MQKLLFLCTGNYYRSRYAEIYFNWQAEKLGLAWNAFSRGLNPSPFNEGPMSEYTLAALRNLDIPFDSHLRLPIVASAADFEAAQHVIAVKEAEHRPLIERNFPRWLSHVEFWHVHDLDYCGPEDALPCLTREVTELMERLRERP